MVALSRENTPFSRLARACRDLEGTTKRNEKTTIIADLLNSLHPAEIAPATLFLSGNAFPESDPRVLEVSYATISEAERNLGQARLTNAQLTVLEVYETLARMAEATGPNSRTRKLNLVQTLLTRSSKDEADFLTRMLLREMRIGVVEGVLLDAISKASGIPRDVVRKANMLHGDIGDLARKAISEGVLGLEKIQLRLFVPIKPMLAEIAADPGEALTEHIDGTAFEYKFDGARIQIHRSGDKIRIFSRRLTDVTESLSDMVEFARTHVNSSEYVIEGEAIAIGEGGRPVPFQDLMRRFRRVHEIEEMSGKIPLRLYLFDALYLEGRTLIDQPYTVRWEILSQLVPTSSLTPRIVTRDRAEAESFLKTALKEGHEGLMAKSLTSNYSPGARGKKWFKIKSADTLDVVIVAADWGSGRRVGWLSNYHLAVRDEDTGEFMIVGKTFKGLTDDEFDTITARLKRLKVRESHYTVHVKPAIVAEVAYSEVQKSPIYKSGFALRFARIARFRDDKLPIDANTLQDLRQRYNRQFETKARLSLGK
ncbi:ATP-dependent DNA ligase [Candidatus Bathyarchaeota archaeon]|nr:MAG: ATP-dependent DNA ligase [Candidatus Bathyarchaeota archaeon]TMI33183.1 MAG: ATP-dependent DNA ligase [Candidatus Bathyarchaeota archaeon]